MKDYKCIGIETYNEDGLVWLTFQSEHSTLNQEQGPKFSTSPFLFHLLEPSCVLDSCGSLHQVSLAYNQPKLAIPSLVDKHKIIKPKKPKLTTPPTSRRSSSLYNIKILYGTNAYKGTTGQWTSWGKIVV